MDEAMASEGPQNLTYRVDNIPKGTTPAGVKRMFHSDDQEAIEVKSLAPNTENFEGDGELMATVLYHGDPATPPRKVRSGLDVSRDFVGFTVLNAVEGLPTADIIAITGLAGHAFGSWQSKKGRMWLRDELPAKLNHRARILLYGYNSQLQGPDAGQSILRDYCGQFWHDLMNIRDHPSCQDRPIIFICHSLGGLVIKQCITDEDPVVLSRSHLRAIFFFGTPHQGLNIEALRTVVFDRKLLSRQLILQLERGSPTLQDLQDKFLKRVRNTNVLIFTYYETLPTETVVANKDGTLARAGEKQIMVDASSAILNCDRETKLQVPGDHRTMVKLTNERSGLFLRLIGHLKECLKSAPEIHNDKIRSALTGQDNMGDNNVVEGQYGFARDDLTGNVRRVQRSSTLPIMVNDSSAAFQFDMSQGVRSITDRMQQSLRSETVIRALNQRLSPIFGRDGTREEVDQGLEDDGAPLEKLDSGSRIASRRLNSDPAPPGQRQSEQRETAADIASNFPSPSPASKTERGNGRRAVGDGCDICRRAIYADELYYHCTTCKDQNGDTYDMCAACEARIGTCTAGHDLVKKRPAPARTCGICRRKIQNSETHYSCKECNGGHWDACCDCEDKGETCPGGHSLFKIRPAAQKVATPLPSPPTSAVPTFTDRRSYSIPSRSRDVQAIDDDDELQDEGSFAQPVEPLAGGSANRQANKPDDGENLRGKTSKESKEFAQTADDLIQTPPASQLRKPSSSSTGDSKGNTHDDGKYSQDDAETNVRPCSCPECMSKSASGPCLCDVCMAKIDEMRCKCVKCSTRTKPLDSECTSCGQGFDSDDVQFTCLDCSGVDLHADCFLKWKTNLGDHKLWHRCATIDNWTRTWNPQFKPISTQIQPLVNPKTSVVNLRLDKNPKIWWTNFGTVPNCARFVIDKLPAGEHIFELTVDFNVSPGFNLSALNSAMSKAVLHIGIGTLRDKSRFLNDEYQEDEVHDMFKAQFSEYHCSHTSPKYEQPKEVGGTTWSQTVHFENSSSITLGKELLGVSLSWGGMPQSGREGDEPARAVLEGSISALVLRTLDMDCEPMTASEYKERLADSSEGEQIRVTILGGGDFRHPRIFSFPDPFVDATIDGKRVLKTAEAGETSDPFWNEDFEITVKPSDTMVIRMWDSNTLHKSDGGLLGRAEIEIGEQIDLVTGGDATSRWNLITPKGKVRGWVEVRLATVYDS